MFPHAAWYFDGNFVKLALQNSPFILFVLIGSIMVKSKMKELVGHGQICVDGGTHLILARTYSIYILCCGNMQHGILMGILSNLRFKIRHSYHLFSKMKELDGHRKT
jgi:hypothetical protein